MGSIRIKITLGIIIIIGAILLVSGKIAVEEQRMAMLAQMDIYGKGSAEFIAKISIIPIQKYSIYQLENHAAHMEKGQFVAYCVIYDTQNNPLTNTSKHDVTSENTPEILVFNSPITDNNISLGRVELGIHLSPVITMIDHTTNYIKIAFVIELLLIGFALSFFIHKSLVSPILRLSNTTRDIANGRFAISDQANRSDELGGLAKSINEMSINLRESYRTLELKVSERTAELSKAKNRAEQVSRHLEVTSAELQALLDNSPVGILFVTPERVIQRVNLELSRITGYTAKELIGKSTRVLYQNEDNYETAGNIISNLLERQGVWQATLELERKDRTPIVCAMRGKLTVLDGGMKGIIWSIEDITARLKMEEELLKIKKLESIGVLAGGIAHDFNNILVAVIGNISLSERLVQDNPKAVELLTAARHASLRAKDLTGKLLTFAKTDGPTLTAEQLPDIIRESTSFVLTDSNVQCVYDFPDDLGTVHMDKRQMIQVIHNLVLNAKYSMSDGGTISLTCRNQQLVEEEITGLKSGSYVRLEIEDCGSGIAPEHLDKIFDPYFSTKPKDSNKGGGLGLSIVHSIMSKHHGTITVNSTLGQGSTFSLYLPATSDSGMPKPLPGPQSILPSGKGLVLVMDDEETAHSVTKEMLAYLGYESIHTYDGEDTLKVYSKHKKSKEQPIDAVIMDLIIPGGMGGATTVALLKKIDPKAKVIVSSGYSDDPILHDYESAGFDNMVSKPFQLLDLSKVISDTLR